MDENIIVAVLPQKFKVTNYKANVEGDWKITGNTYTFYSKKVKGASVLIDFEDTMPYAYAEVAKALAKFNDINIAYDGENVKVAMPSEGMFASGQITIEKKGKEWLYNLAETLKRIKIKELRVEGHTDNIPIKKSSQKLYPSNWELSAGRAANIVRFLIDAGLDYKKLAAVGYADSRPVVDNDTPANRAKNRRIEFTIVPVDEGPESESNTDQKAEIQ
ncbi:MAG: OmpA family protein [Deltaproteobacteria bacterium]|nr:OmpA family protein [Deltaproteobacteria bacterium]